MNDMSSWRALSLGLNPSHGANRREKPKPWPTGVPKRHACHCEQISGLLPSQTNENKILGAIEHLKLPKDVGTKEETEFPARAHPLLYSLNWSELSGAPAAPLR